MRALDRKLVRDLRRMWAQVLSIALLVGAGVMTVVALFSTYDSVATSREAYYDAYRFADVFATLRRAPEPLARRIEQLPGVMAVHTRIVREVLLEVPGVDEAATARLVSVPAPHAPTLNDVYLRAGRWVEPGRTDEVVASERFAHANGLALGDSLGALVNGRWRSLRIVGIGLSPEFVYEVSGAIGFSDERLYGVLWVARETMAAAFDMEDAFNDIAVALAPGVSAPPVLAGIDALIAPYGGLGTYARADQPSELVVSSELAQLRVTGEVVPALFLAIAAFLLNVVLARLVATEREEIAILKAFGYADSRIATHYLGFAVAATMVGAGAGVPGGLWLGSAYTELYGQYFLFPNLRYTPSWPAIIGAIAVSTFAAIAGSLLTVRSVMRLQPAEAMRPPSPARFRPLLLERIGLGGLVSPAGRMLLRNLERTPVRSGLSALGIGLAMAVLVLGLFMLDMVGRMGDLQFRIVQRDDIAVGFDPPVPADAVDHLARIPGVWRAEPFRTTAVRLHNAQHVRTVALTGRRTGDQLRRLVDLDGRVHALPPGGLVLDANLADALDVTAGDTVRIELLELGGRTERIAIAATIAEMIGVSAYLEAGALARLLREAPAASGALLAVDREAEADVFARLKRIPAVTGASSRRAQLASFESQVSETLWISATFIVVFAALIAVGVIYNGARVSLSERGRELASLRVLGFTRPEVTRLLLGEQALLTAIALPIGSLIGVVFSVLIVRAIHTDLFRMPLYLRAESHIIAALIVLAVAGLTGAVVRRRVHRLDLVAVLKTRE